jgi:phage-related protein
MHELFFELNQRGCLEPPDAKKLGNTDLFEVRINKNGTWRCIYAYKDDYIVLLTAFQKKTMKTPLKQIHTSLQRLNNLNEK